MRHARISELRPGDRVHHGRDWGIYVARMAPHPLYPGLCLVVWRLSDGTWSHDALDFTQAVGEVDDATDDQRRQALRWALLGSQQWGSSPRRMTVDEALAAVSAYPTMPADMAGVAATLAREVRRLRDCLIDAGDSLHDLGATEPVVARCRAAARGVAL